MESLRLLIMNRMEKLTQGERKIANTIFADYPFSALGTAQDLAEKAGVSIASLTRFVSKFGFEGFKDFQRLLVDELQEGQRSPRDLADSIRVAPNITSQNTPRGTGNFLSLYVGQIGKIIDEMTASVPAWQFDKFVELLWDSSRNIFLIGGRISNKIAAFLSVNLRQIRGGIFHISENPEIWPEYVLRMRRKDVVVFLDFRRYQQNLMQLAATIKTQAHPHILLITDKWMSPIAHYSKQVVALPTHTKHVWDTMIPAAIFAEALIVKILEDDWETAKKRIQKWDTIRGVSSLMDKN